MNHFKIPQSTIAIDCVIQENIHIYLYSNNRGNPTLYNPSTSQRNSSLFPLNRSIEKVLSIGYKKKMSSYIQILNLYLLKISPVPILNET